MEACHLPCKRERLEVLLGKIRDWYLVQGVLCLHSHAMSGPSPAAGACCPGQGDVWGLSSMFVWVASAPWGPRKSSCFAFNFPEPSAFLCTPVTHPLLLNCRALPYLTVVSTEDDPCLCTRCPSLYMSYSTKSLWWKTKQGSNLQIKEEKIKDWWQNVTLWA